MVDFQNSRFIILMLNGTAESAANLVDEVLPRKPTVGLAGLEVDGATESLKFLPAADV